MRNKEMPAHPVHRADDDGDVSLESGFEKAYCCTGMTKYEHVVLEFAKSLVSNGARDPDMVVATAQQLAHQYFKRLD